MIAYYFLAFLSIAVLWGAALLGRLWDPPAEPTKDEADWLRSVRIYPATLLRPSNIWSYNHALRQHYSRPPDQGLDPEEAKQRAEYTDKHLAELLKGWEAK